MQQLASDTAPNHPFNSTTASHGNGTISQCYARHAMLPLPLPMPASMPASTAAEIKCCSTVRKAKWQWQQQWQQLHADPLQHSRLFFNLKNVLNMIFSYAICYHYLPHCGKSLVCWTGDTFSRGDAPLALCLKLIACFYKKYFFAKLNFKLGTG